MSAFTVQELVESPRRRRLHLISGSVVVTILYAGLMLVLRNVIH